MDFKKEEMYDADSEHEIEDCQGLRSTRKVSWKEMTWDVVIMEMCFGLALQRLGRSEIKNNTGLLFGRDELRRPTLRNSRIGFL